MRKQTFKLILIIFSVILVLIVSYRIIISSNPIGTGETRTSPNGQYEASVLDFTGEDFLGKTQQWYEFKIKSKSTTKKFTTSPISEIYFGSRSNNQVIFWESDSSVVKFIFPEAEVRVKTANL